MSAQKLAALPAQPSRFDERVGAVRVEVLGGEDRGTLVLTPPDGQALQIRIEDGAMTLSYAGPEVRLEAPEGHLQLEARTIGLKATESVEVHGGTEVDIHSGADVEVRADHHVNLWGFGVNVGD